MKDSTAAPFEGLKPAPCCDASGLISATVEVNGGIEQHGLCYAPVLGQGFGTLPQRMS